MKDSSDVLNSGPGKAQPDSVSSSLLDRLRAQSPDAWDRFVDLFLPVLYQQGRRSGLQSADARDVAQEVLQAVSAGVGKFHRQGPHASFRGWLWTLSRNKIVDCLRRQGRMENAIGGSSAREWFDRLPAKEHAQCEDRFSASLYRRGLELIQGEFTQRTWKAFWRLAVDGCTPADVADELGVSVNAIYLAKSRVLRRLREELGDMLD